MINVGREWIMADFFGFAEELLRKGRAKKGDPYADAELYDLLVREARDDHFYIQFAQRLGGKVLDLACGSGRLIPGLLGAGLEVTGIDLSPAMLERARERLGLDADRVELVQGDMRSFSLQDSFDTIMIPYCSFMYLYSDKDRLVVLNNCFGHLKPGGRLVFDFLAGSVELGESWPALALQGIHPLTEEILLSVVQTKGLAADLRLLNQINYIWPMEPDTPHITVYSSKEAVLVPERVVELLGQAGFVPEGVYRDSSLEAYDGGEECLIVARR